MVVKARDIMDGGDIKISRIENEKNRAFDKGKCENFSTLKE